MSTKSVVVLAGMFLLATARPETSRVSRSALEEAPSLGYYHNSLNNNHVLDMVASNPHMFQPHIKGPLEQQQLLHAAAEKNAAVPPVAHGLMMAAPVVPHVMWWAGAGVDVAESAPAAMWLVPSST